MWVNTIGTRPPRLDLQTARRAVEKLRHWTRPVPGVPAGGLQPRIISPRMWPSFGSPAARWVNRQLIARALRPVLAALPSPPLVLTTLPITADLVGAFPAAGWLYYCVDDFGTWPGYDGRTMQSMEVDLVARVDRVIAVSDALAAHLKRLGRDAPLLAHGVDLAHWRAGPGSSSGSATTPPPEFDGLSPPYVVFWGAIDRRMDLAFLRAIASRLTQGTVVLIGPQDDPDPTLHAIPRVAVRPALPYERLPAIGAAADVLVMPYADLPATRAMQPLKLKEYLATGKSVVVRALPATVPWAQACDVCADAEAFANTVLARLAEGTPPRQQAARRTLDDEGWDAKARQLAAWLDTLADGTARAGPGRCAGSDDHRG